MDQEITALTNLDAVMRQYPPTIRPSDDGRHIGKIPLNPPFSKGIIYHFTHQIAESTKQPLSHNLEEQQKKLPM